MTMTMDNSIRVKPVFLQPIVEGGGKAAWHLNFHVIFIEL
jgi:hypothetical protein